MSTRPILLLAAFLAAGALAGCGASRGTSEARENARNRLNHLNAQLARDQAWQEYETGQFEKALTSIESALALQPKVAEYHLLHGRICLETARLEQASKALETALELDSGNADAHYFLGIVHQRWSDDASAYRDYLAAHEADPTVVAYALAAAETLVALEDYDGAERFITEKLDYFEHNAALHQLLAQVAMLEGDVTRAADLYGEAWRLDPENDVLLTELAHAQFAAKRYEKCLGSIRELVRLAGTRRPDLLSFEARCLAAMERFPEALNLYVELTRVTPQDAEVWTDLGAVAWEAQSFHQVALAASRLRQIAPERPEGYLLMAVNERHHGNLEEAIGLLEQAASRSPDQALPHLMLGQLLEEQGELDAALDAYAAGMAVEPESEEAAALWSRLAARQRTASVPQEGRHRE